MLQLYANNAKTTLDNAIGTSDTAIIVVDGSKFPTPGANEFFLVTLEIDTQREILLVTGRSGNTFTIAATGRAQENTTASAFARGAVVECRVTRDTLRRMSRSLIQIAGVETLVAPKDSYNDGYVCGTFDPSGNPVLCIAKDAYTWRYINYTPQLTTTATAGTTTSATAASIPLSGLTAGKYLIQFTSGTNTGYVRLLTSIVGATASWVQALPTAVVNSDTFEIVKANSSIILEALAIGDDAVIMPLLLGGN